MKKIFIAFTYIELIVVISIITILSSSWVYYFLDLAKNQELNQKINTINDNINDLEKKIINYSIFDYEIRFSTANWWLWYINYINNFDNTYNQNINLNLINWSWTLWTNWNSSQEWNLIIYKNIKLYVNVIRQSDSLYNYYFNEKQFYKIIWTLSWETLNEIDIRYFAEDNVYPEKNNSLSLKTINTKEDKSWTGIINLSIINIWGNKSLLWDWVNTNEVYLFLELDWKEGFIKITK